MWTIFKVFTEFVIVLLLFYALVFWPWGMWDLHSPTRDRTHTPSKGRQSLNHWMAREVPQIIHSFIQQTPHHWECHCPGLEIVGGRGGEAENLLQKIVVSCYIGGESHFFSWILGRADVETVRSVSTLQRRLNEVVGSGEKGGGCKEMNRWLKWLTGLECMVGVDRSRGARHGLDQKWAPDSCLLCQLLS